MTAVNIECSRCCKTYSHGELSTVCTSCGGSLLFKYDLPKISETVSKGVLEKRADTFWKFMELLPLSSSKSIVSLGEPYTPILDISLEHSMTSPSVYAKDDGRLPTGTFKARGMAVAVSTLKELGVISVAIPSAGNAGAALSAYGTKAGMKVYAFMPKDLPESNLKECLYLGAKVYLVDGLIGDAADALRKFREDCECFDVSTNKQPYRFEGYKAAAFEVAEQFGWNLPDRILFPTGGGEGVIGLWKGFKELDELGWIRNIPKLTVVQSSGCAPLVEAFKKNEVEVNESWQNAETIAAGLRVPYPYASYLVLRAVRETGGMAIAVDDKDIISSMKAFFRMGIYACPEAASTLAALRKMETEDDVDSDEKVLLYLTGNAMKYFDVMKLEKTRITIVGNNAESLG